MMGISAGGSSLAPIAGSRAWRQLRNALSTEPPTAAAGRPRRRADECTQHARSRG
jgi:hypothetical protein